VRTKEASLSGRLTPTRTLYKNVGHTEEVTALSLSQSHSICHFFFFFSCLVASLYGRQFEEPRGCSELGQASRQPDLDLQRARSRSLLCYYSQVSLSPPSLFLGPLCLDYGLYWSFIFCGWFAAKIFWVWFGFSWENFRRTGF
jgi:hypothetical protein